MAMILAFLASDDMTSHEYVDHVKLVLCHPWDSKFPIQPPTDGSAVTEMISTYSAMQFARHHPDCPSNLFTQYFDRLIREIELRTRTIRVADADAMIKAGMLKIQCQRGLGEKVRHLFATHLGVGGPVLYDVCRYAYSFFAGQHRADMTRSMINQSAGLWHRGGPYGADGVNTLPSILDRQHRFREIVRLCGSPRDGRRVVLLDCNAHSGRIRAV